MKRIIAAVLLLSLLLLAGCGAKPAETPQPDQPTSAPTGEPTPGAATPAVSEDGRIILTIGAFKTENGANFDLQSYYRLEQAVKRFNDRNKTYVVEIKDYGDAASPDALYLLNSEIGAGQMPDMLVTYGMPVEKYGANGLLVDLYEWYDKAEFFSGPLRSMETDGKLYKVSSAVSIVTCYGLKDVVGEEGGYENIYRAWSEFDTGNKMFITQLDALNTFMLLTEIQFSTLVDKSKAECRFNTSEFIGLLEFCKTLPAEPIATETELYAQNVNPMDIMPLCVKNRDAMLGLFTTQAEIGAVDALHASLLTVLDGEEITFTGVPGTSPAASGCFCELPIAVSAKSANLDGAREFLDSLWDVRYTQFYEGELRTIPLMRSVFDDHYKAEMARAETLTDENGVELRGIVYVDYLPYTEEDLQAFAGLIENASLPVSSLNVFGQAEPIILEEAIAFFGGIQSAEQTAENIQTRYTLFLEEQK